MKKLLVTILVFLFSSQTFAISDSEIEHYKKWQIKTNPNASFQESLMSNEYCMGISSGYVVGGDLLSSLIVDSNIVDSKWREKIHRDLPGDQPFNTGAIYNLNQDDLVKLDKKIVKYLKKNFYVRSLCHRDNIDIISGTMSYDGKGQLVTLLIHGEKTLKIRNLPIIVSSPSGGDSSFCKGISSIGKNTITWSCTVGFETDDYGLTGNTYVEYITISLKNGKVLKKQTKLTQ